MPKSNNQINENENKYEQLEELKVGGNKANFMDMLEKELQKEQQNKQFISNKSDKQEIENYSEEKKTKTFLKKGDRTNDPKNM